MQGLDHQTTDSGGRALSIDHSGELGVIVDSGATVRAIGGPRQHPVKNKTLLGTPVCVDTASGKVKVTRMDKAVMTAVMTVGVRNVKRHIALYRHNVI